MGSSEDQILRRAIERALIEARELESLEDAVEPAGRWGPRIERLIESGRLDPITVAALAEEVNATLFVESAATTLDASSRGSVDRATPETWDRYRIIARIGGGGGGEVFHAHDPRLGRDVALKFLHAEAIEVSARLRREAQAQARIEHEHVCKVFEVGEVGGRSFIAMQFIDGETLDVAAAKMTVEERVRIVRAIADAVHAAHAMGIVHRDLKPQNVLVERSADGAFKPWVVDFGLAREMERGGSTVGAVGTPAFMAPEQARGSSLIDRRCDVYGLGATLFAVLTGRAPFVGSTAEMLVQVLGEDSAPMRGIVRSLPLDLETVVAKCLEKDPERRYDSARALAEELQRFLDGVPIHARPAGLSRRLLLRAKKHKAIAAVGAIALIIVGVVVSLWANAILNARTEARLVQELARDSSAIEQAMRIAHLLPLHDVRPERERIRSEMRAVEARLRAAGAIAEGPGEYALGRGALALHDLSAARLHLEKAWEVGHRAPEVEEALGQTLGEQYRAALQLIEGTESETARKAARESAARELRDPAIAHLRRGRSTTQLLALIALYEGRYEDALKGAETAEREEPSLYEAAQLAGETYTRMASNRRESGELDAAYELATRGAAPYQRAIDFGRSDEESYIGECERRLQILRLDADRGRPVDEDAAGGIAVADLALTINPDSTRAWNLKSQLYWRLGERMSLRGVDPRPTLELSAKAAQEALARDPTDALAHFNHGSASLIRAQTWERRHGIDPRPALMTATESLERAVAAHPTSTGFVSLGIAAVITAEYERAHGGDPLPPWERGERFLKRAMALDPRFSVPYNSLGNLLNGRAEWELRKGVDPHPSTERAIEALKKAIELQPSYAYPHNNIGVAYWMRAVWDRSNGLDCASAVDEAVKSYRRTLELMPSYPYAYNNIADSYCELAMQQVERAIDPTDTLQRARAILDEGLKLNAKNHFNDLVRAHVELIAARSRMPKDDARPLLDRALAAAARGAENDPEDADVPAIDADIRRTEVEWLLAHRRVADRELELGSRSAARALAISPNLPEAIAAQGALLHLRALMERDPEKRKQLDAESELISKRAFDINPLLKHDYR